MKILSLLLACSLGLQACDDGSTAAATAPSIKDTVATTPSVTTGSKDTVKGSTNPTKTDTTKTVPPSKPAPSLSPFDSTWNHSIAYDTLKDPRDGMLYRTITLGSQTWMAENLAYDTVGSRILRDYAEYGKRYGRLYDWTTAVGSSNCNFGPCSLPKTVQGICPVGWHIPSPAEWDTLSKFAKKAKANGADLRAGTDWTAYAKPAKTSDDLGMRILPSSSIQGVMTFDPGSSAYFWCNRDTLNTTAAQVMIDYSNGTDIRAGIFERRFYIAVRCLKDSP
jgi:uncharacterized protein (TIGR02145 family)